MIETKNKPGNGFDFSPDPVTSIEYANVSPGSWLGFLSTTIAEIQSGQNVSITFDVQIGGGSSMADLIGDIMAASPVVANDEANPDGTLTGNHQQLLDAGPTGHQISKDAAKCRAKMQKFARKVSKATGKGVCRCLKDELAAGNTGAVCYTGAGYDAAPSSKVTKARNKLLANVAKCNPDEDADIIVEYATCPAPAPANALGSLTDVHTCVADLAELVTAGQLQAQIGTPVGILDGDQQGLHASICSRSAKYLDAIVKNLGKSQAGEEKAPADGFYPGYVADGADPKGKVTGAKVKARGAIADDCDDVLLAGGTVVTQTTCAQLDSDLFGAPDATSGSMTELGRALSQAEWEGDVSIVIP